MRGKHEDWDDELLARAAGLKRAGFSNAQIAEKLGKPVGSVRNRMARVGAKVRLTGTGGKPMFKVGRTGLEMFDTTHETIELLGTSEGREK